MRRSVAFAGFALGGLALVATGAQDKGTPALPPEMVAMMAAHKKAGALSESHKALEAFVGEWTTSAKILMPGMSPMESAGTASGKSLFGGRFVQAWHQGTMMGEPHEGIATTGYDNTKQKFVSTWIASGETSITYAEGTYDPASKTFTFSGQMDDPATGAKTPFRFTEKIADRDKIVFEWYSTMEGKESKMMEVLYTRKR